MLDFSVLIAIAIAIVLLKSFIGFRHDMIFRSKHQTSKVFIFYFIILKVILLQ